jgi:thiamine biosynthesis lipoprotein
MNRRSFLKFPALLPLSSLAAALGPDEHHFAYEGVLGTSMDLTVSAPDSRVAQGVCRTVLDEIDRLASILSTRDPNSEISLLENDTQRHPSSDLKAVLDAYDHWERRTNGVFSIRSDGPDRPRNVDALGKAYILDRAVYAAHRQWPWIDSLLLDIGGDIVVWGASRRIGVADPLDWYDNADPMTSIDLRNAAVATSGTYARGAHLNNPLTGQSTGACTAATVIARDAITANALATTLCLGNSAGIGLELVESTPGAEALRVASGLVQRTSGFARLERPLPLQAAAAQSTAWPPGFQLKITLPLTSGRASKRQYVAVWVEDATGKLVRVLAVWGSKSKYYPDLAGLWSIYTGRQESQIRAVSRATRSAGRYEIVWTGLDGDNRPVPLGTYRIVVETNQERGTYAKQSGTIVLGDSPTSITLPATTNFDTVTIQYGPK